MLQFLIGALTGAAIFKYYQVQQQQQHQTEEEEENKNSPLFTSGNRDRNSTTYNECADTTQGATTHVNFLSDIVQRLWPYLSKAGEQMVRDTVEPTFRDTLPGPLSTLHFTKLELGAVPLVLDNILVRELQSLQEYGGTQQSDYLQFEWDVCWNSTCNIQLETDIIGIGGFGAPISFGVKGITLNGRLQIIANPLSSTLPCIDAIQFAFVNPPEVELDFTGLANLADMKVKIGGINLVDIKGYVRQIVDDVFAQAIVLPNRSYAPLVEHVDYRDQFCPAYQGLARIHVHSGRGFEIEKTKNPLFGKDDIPDVYLKIRLGVEPWFVSSTVQDNCTPTWNPNEDCQDFLYCSSRDQIVEIEAWDSDSGTLDTDDRLGVASVSLGHVLLQSRGPQGTMEIQLLKKATSKGKNPTMTDSYVTISLETLPFTTKELSSLVITEDVLTKRNSLTKKESKKWEKTDGKRVLGLSTILVSHATELPYSNDKDANTFIKVWLAKTGEEAHKETRQLLGETPVVAGSVNPKYHKAIVTPLTLNHLMKNQGNLSYIFEMLSLATPDEDIKNATTIGEIVITNEEVVANQSSMRATKIIGAHHKKDRNKYNTKLALTIAFAGVEKSKRDGRKFTAISEAGNNSHPSESETIGGGSSTECVDPLSTHLPSKGVENRIRVRIVKAWGFQTVKKKLLQKADIPDVYCIVKFGSSPAVWRTPTIKDNERPTWDNETHDYIMESMNEVISIDAWDENRRSDDEFYGHARTSVGKILLNGGSLDLELRDDVKSPGRQSGMIAKEIKGNKTAMKNKFVKFGNKLGMDLVVDKPQSTMYITVECYKL